MKLSDFDFYLPPELIAQEPLKERDQSNLIIAEIDHFFPKDSLKILFSINSN